MDDTKPTQSTRWFDWLVQQPLLLAILVIVVIMIIGLIGLLTYLLITGPPGSETAFASTPTVSFVTPTASVESTATPSTTGPSVALSPVKGDTGTLVTITGKNWTPGDNVVARLDDPTGNQNLQPLFANAQIASNGTFLASFILQANTGWGNLTNVQVTVESSATGDRVAAEFSIIDQNQGPSPTPEATTPPATQPVDTPTVPPGESTPTPSPTTEFIPSPGDWQAKYYSNPDLVGSPVLERNELAVDFNWRGEAPAPTLPRDGFSARWTRSYDLGVAVYRFHLFADDGVRLWINDEVIIDEWYASAPREISVDYTTSYSGIYDVRIEYADFAGDATIRFSWERVGPLPPPAPPRHAWLGAYWPNVDLSGNPLLVREDPNLNFNWGTNSPALGLPADNFSARWDRLVDFEPANYRFFLTVNDGARLWVDGRILIDEWRDGDTREITRDFAMTGGPHELRVEYFDRTGDATIRLRWEKTPPATATLIPSFPDWQGQYWSNPDLSGNPIVTRNDPAINFNWGTGAPDSALPVNNFSARWSRSFNFENGLYRFTVESNDGIRFYLDGMVILNEWSDTPVSRNHTFDLNLNGRHWLVVEYYDRTGDAVARFRWEQLNPTQTPTPTSTATATPTYTATPTATPSQTSTPSPTSSPTYTPSPSPTGTFTPTPSPTSTFTLTPSPTITTTLTITPTLTETPTGESP